MYTNFPHHKQRGLLDCGITCLAMIYSYYKRNNKLLFGTISKEKLSFYDISELAKEDGFHCLGVRVNFEELKDMTMPCIVHWKQSHFVVVYGFVNGAVCVADPASNLLEVEESLFQSGWLMEGGKGFALIIHPES